MIYQCYTCKKLFNEDNGAMVLENNLTIPIPTTQILMVFKCKSCISKKGRDEIEILQKKKKD